MSNVVEVTDLNFEEEVLKSTIPVFVDFWATWCGPCKVLEPVMKRFAEEFAGQYKVCKVDTDEAVKTVQKYKIKGVPTILLFKDGQMIAQKVGTIDFESLKKMVQNQ